MPIPENHLKPIALLEAIRDADYGAAGPASLHLFRLTPDFFEGLCTEVLQLTAIRVSSVVGRAGHVTYWTQPFGEALQFSLLNRSGKYNDTSSDHDNSCRGKRFHEKDQFPLLQQFIAAFPHAVNFRLNILGPNSGLRPHEEHVTIRLVTGDVGIRARFHLPIISNPKVTITVNWKKYHFAEGNIYFFHNGMIHGAENQGRHARIHLVWDMLMTEPAAKLMFGGKAPPPFLNRISGPDREVQPVGESPAGPFAKSRWSVEEKAASPLVYCEVQ